MCVDNNQLTPEQMIDYMASEWAHFGYQKKHFRVMPDKTIIGLLPMISTWGLHYNVTLEGYSGRYCYRDYVDAKCALDEVEVLDRNNSPDDPMWIVHKGKGTDFPNPLAELREAKHGY